MKGGTFLCKVISPTNGWFGEAGTNNTPFIRIPLVVEQEGPSEGDQIVFQGWITDKSVAKTVKNLSEVFGWDGDLEALAGMVNTGPFVGKQCEIVTEEDEYNGKTRVVIKWLNSPGSGGKSMDKEKAIALARRLSARSKDAATTTPPSHRKPPSDPDLDAPEDDIPF